jgi:hypothetical protein
MRFSTAIARMNRTITPMPIMGRSEDLSVRL